MRAGNSYDLLHDRLSGKTTLEEYENADIKILVFGDSFSEWNQEATWPDLMQRHLEAQLGRKVGVLDFALAG